MLHFSSTVIVLVASDFTADASADCLFVAASSASEIIKEIYFVFFVLKVESLINYQIKNIEEEEEEANKNKNKKILMKNKSNKKKFQIDYTIYTFDELIKKRKHELLDSIMIQGLFFLVVVAAFLKKERKRERSHVFPF